MVARVMVFGRDNWPTDYGDNNAAADQVTGTSAANTIDLGGGNDTADAGAGDDTVTPGRGLDNITLGPGIDTVVLTSVLDSPAASPDQIVDFRSGEDLLDLKQVDANVLVAGDQDFNFIFNRAFSRTAAELRIDTATGRVEGDVDGNGTADLVIAFGSQVPSGGGEVLFIVTDGGTPPPSGDLIL